MAPERLPLPMVPGLDQVLAALPRARLVGGAVRDLLAGLLADDIDLATPDAPPEVITALRAAGLPAIPTGLAHGTITTVAAGRPFQITTLRRDVATDGRRATVAYTDDWTEDAARRDFTLNAMSLERNGTLHDPFEGATDLAAGRLRFVGDPARRIEEDRLRALRYIRFYARFANLPPDPPTLAALAAAAAQIDRLSPERVGQELRRILAAPSPAAALALMQQTGLLAATIGPANLPHLEQLLRTAAPPHCMLRLASLTTKAEVPRLTTALRLSNSEAATLSAFLADPPPAPTEAAIATALSHTAAEILAARAWLAGQGALATRLLATPPPIFPLRGADLRDAGIPQGAAIGEALSRARAHWLQQSCEPDRASLLAYLGLPSA